MKKSGDAIFKHSQTLVDSWVSEGRGLYVSRTRTPGTATHRYPLRPSKKMAIVDKERLIHAGLLVASKQTLSLILMAGPHVKEIHGKKLRRILDPVLPALRHVAIEGLRWATNKFRSEVNPARRQGDAPAGVHGQFRK